MCPCFWKYYCCCGTSVKPTTFIGFCFFWDVINLSQTNLTCFDGALPSSSEVSPDVTRIRWWLLGRDGFTPSPIVCLLSRDVLVDGHVGTLSTCIAALYRRYLQDLQENLQVRNTWRKAHQSHQGQKIKKKWLKHQGKNKHKGPSADRWCGTSAEDGSAPCPQEPYSSSYSVWTSSLTNVPVWNPPVAQVLFLLLLRTFLRELEDCVEKPEMVGTCFLKRVSTADRRCSLEAARPNRGFSS